MPDLTCPKCGTPVWSHSCLMREKRSFYHECDLTEPQALRVAQRAKALQHLDVLAKDVLLWIKRNQKAPGKEIAVYNRKVIYKVAYRAYLAVGILGAGGRK